jgi:hypothetical protein
LKPKFNTSAAIRELIAMNPLADFAEIFEELVKTAPRTKHNRNSAYQAFYHAKKNGRHKAPTRLNGSPRAVESHGAETIQPDEGDRQVVHDAVVDVASNMIRAAKALIAITGDVDKAHWILDELR